MLEIFIPPLIGIFFAGLIIAVRVWIDREFWAEHLFKKDGKDQILPDIEKDPLAIEINKAHRRHLASLLASFDNDIQAKIDLIEMVLGLPISYPTDDRDQRYISAPLIDRGELRQNIKKNGPIF